MKSSSQRKADRLWMTAAALVGGIRHARRAKRRTFIKPRLRQQLQRRGRVYDVAVVTTAAHCKIAATNSATQATAANAAKLIGEIYAP